MNYQSKVGWSKSSIIITVIVALIAVGAICACIIGNPEAPHKIVVISLLALVLLVVVMFVPVNIEVTDNELLIHRIIGVKRIATAEISECGLSYIPVSMKVCGSGGFCGNIGWYKADDFGVFFSYVLDKNRAFYLILNDGKKYMLSCDDPDEVVHRLRR